MSNFSSTQTTPDSNVSVNISPPNLPVPPPIYSSGYLSTFTNTLRLFFGQVVNALNTILRPAGNWNETFQSGQVQYIGPNNTLNGSNNLIFGLKLPNPSGITAPGLLLGSDVSQAWLITDQAADSVTNGINLGITAGETQPAGNATGGTLELFGGGAFAGTGGAFTAQGGTSFNGPGGPTTISGGNSTHGVPGDLFLIGGQTGTQGANVHLIMTNINGIPGFLRIRVNSTILYQINANGSILIGGSNPGQPGQPLVSGGPLGTATWATTGFSGTITTAKLTTGGTNGSMTFSNGFLANQTPAT
jgi:hypothetical protein